MKLRRWAALAATGLLLTSAACSVLLDHDPTQCHTDGDCAHFGDHPYCQGGLCVSSGLGPAGCFYGTPTQPGEFLNQCTTAQCLSFDSCQHGLCGDAGDLDAALVTPPPPEGGSSGSTGDAGDGG